MKPHLKKGRKGQKRGVLGKSQFCREKKNRKIKEEKRSRKKVRLMKFDFRVHGAYQILVSISKKLSSKKQMCYRFHLELKSRAE